MTSSKPKVLAVLPGIIPSTIMDIIKPMLGLETAGHIKFRVKIELYPTISAIKKADLVIFCRNTEPRYRLYLDYALDHDIPFIYDIDDNFFEIPLDTPLGQYHRDPVRIQMLNYYLRSADLVRVYSKPLLERAANLNSQVQEIVAPLDWSLICPPSRQPEDKRLRIIYATSRQRDKLFSIFSQALMQVLHEYPNQTQMYFWGFMPTEFQDMPNVHHLKYMLNYNQFMKKFSSMGFDIGLAPLLGDSFHRSKTNNKFREYGACGIAGIYSNVDVYTDCVQDGETGLLVPDEPEAWYSALVSLIEDEHLRRNIAQAAKAKVQQLYSHERFQEQWWQQIQFVLANAREKPHLEQYKPAAVEPDQPKPRHDYNIPGIWILRKAWRALLYWWGCGIKEFVASIQLHTTNMWWSFKLNVLKRV